MNRIKSYLEPAPESEVAETAALYDSGSGMAFCETEEGVSRENAATLFFPLHFESRYRYPLIVWMKGGPFATDSLADLMTRINVRSYVGVSVPQDDAADSGEAWPQTSEGIERASESVQDAIRQAGARFQIDRRRVFIAGSGSGGTMAFRMAFRFPHLFAGAASLEGAVPGNLQPLQNLSRSRDVPLFWAQMRDSRQLPEAVICQQLRLLYVAGFDLTLRQYPADGCKSDTVFRDLNRWIMEQIARQPDSAVIF